ncbi:heterokaryon incompatibility protein-domain-containing protein [Cubamyces lactineus]|nr:heterokaryon incompatibility protein-domain-containing protein [Cubamyces lactineus]
MVEGAPSPLKPFTVAVASKACQGALGASASHESPLRLLERNAEGLFEVVAYRGQPYVAISYCWPGDPSFERLGDSDEPTLVVDLKGQVVQSGHFSSFISHASQSYDPSLAVWIDYHCINQDDIDEKTAQVAIMQRIYTKAQTTLVMLEDISLSAGDCQTISKVSAQATPVVRHVLSARWFSRAWCSQELVLSHHAHICVHAEDTGVLHIPADVFWHGISRARNQDPSIPLFSQPRGHLPDTAITTSTCAWAMGIVHHLGCSDDYDKVALVCNLVRFFYRFQARPTAFGFHSVDIALNVLKMVNIIALRRRDFSLLLANHGLGNSFRGHPGFGWAGEPIHGDRFSEMWNQKDFQVSQDLEIALNDVGLLARGCSALIVLEHRWTIHRDCTGLHLTIDGYTRAIKPIHYLPHTSWTWTPDSRHLLDLMTSLAFADRHGCGSATRHARFVFAYLLSQDYELQPEPLTCDLSGLARDLFSDTMSLRDIASAMNFIWHKPTYAVFSTIFTADGNVLFVSGNALEFDLPGRLLFQPYVTRPKLFSPPMVLTVNSMLLNRKPLSSGAYGCVGCLRGLGMIPDVPGNGEQRLCVV